MKFSYNWLNSFFEKDLPEPNELAEKLMMRFFEIEGIEEVNGDTLIDIDILPNRGTDCFSHLGVAREIAAIYDLEIVEPKINFKAKEGNVEDMVEVNIENELTPRYVLRAIKGVKVKETPDFIKDRLQTCGLQSINNIVDITNYVMLEMGQPLHAFDAKKIKGDQIKVRRAREGEKIKTLDGDELELDESILVIADETDPIGIAGIKGGQGPEIDDDTEVIYLESANFEGKTIRRASKKIKLRTDASSRFEHGLDPELADKASKRAIYLMQKYADGKPIKSSVDKYLQKNKPKTLKLSVNKTQSLLGVEVSKDKIINILNKLGFEAIPEKEKIKVKVPTRRMDVSIEEDLIEEVGRIYGYENIDPIKPKASVTTPKTNYQLLWEDKTRNILKGAGFTENYNYTFIDQKTNDLFGFKDLIEMENPVSSEYKYLRPTLLPHLLKNIKNNEKRFNDINIFEIGKIFEDEERKMLGGAQVASNFRRIKGVIDLLFESLGVGRANYKNREERQGVWTAKSAEIVVRGENLGVLGEVSEELLKKMKIENDVFAFELDMEKLAELSSGKTQYKRISKFPAAVKDLSVLVPNEVKYEEVLNIVENAGGEFLVDTDLFDIYEGEGIPEGKKNLGLRFFFQADNKTLKKEEINKLLEKIISSLEDNSDWEVRKNK
ncbi:MAG: phenylalanine--tRNA ligase subunit beta [Patescibacteria group bacterium]